MIQRSLTEAIPPAKRYLALGNFDGMHRGHHRLMMRTVQEAKAEAAIASALVFEPHPQEFLNPKGSFARLTPPEQRLQLFEDQGLMELILTTFDQTFSELAPEAFIEDVLLRRLHAACIYVGESYRFGHRGLGDIALLREAGASLGFTVREIPLVSCAEEVVSSSAIRLHLRQGRLQEALTMLGHEFVLCGTIIPGQGLGRKLGFPTANLLIDPRCLLPMAGVYLCEVYREQRRYSALTNIGLRPSVGGTSLSVEAHLIDFDGDLYGEKLCLSFIGYRREEQHFASLEALKDQIARDVAAIRDL